MGYIGKVPSTVPLTSSDITDGIISNAKLGADSVNSSKISDDSISDEHLDITSITGQTAITSLADTDKFLVSQTSDSGNLKYVENQYLGGGNLVLLAEVESTTNDGTIGVSDKFTATYDFYKFYLMWKQTADGSDTRFRWLTSGSTEVNGSKYVYMSSRHEVNTSDSRTLATDHGGYNHSYALITNNLPSNSEVHFHTLDWTIYNPYKGGPHNRAKVVGTRAYVRTDDVWRGGTMQIDYNDGSSDNYGGFKLFPSTGYMTDYKYQLYGIKGS